MRKKRVSQNGKKFKNPLRLNRSSSSNEEEEWVQLEADVTPPAQTPRSRSPKSGLIIRCLAVLCLCVSIPLGAKWVYENIFYDNEEFVLRRLDITSDGVLSEKKLSEIANVSPGMNLMELDLGMIRERIEMLPQVEKVNVHREMPDRIQIQVRERIGVAWLSCPPQGIRPWDMERGFLMDNEGFLFRCLNLNEEMKRLPVIEAFKMVKPEEGMRLESDAARSALKLIVASRDRFSSEELAVERVRLPNEWSMECAYMNGLRVTFDVYDLERGIEDLAMILDKTVGSGKNLLTVNVVAKKNIPVTFSDGFIPGRDEPGGIAPSELGVPGGDSKPKLSDQEKHLQSILNGG